MAVVPYVRATHSDGQSWSAAKANLLEAGVNDTSYAPAVRVTKAADQTGIVTATETTLTFDTERFDQAGNAADTMHDNSTNPTRLTCRYAGVYQITAHALWSASPVTNAVMRFRLNGATNIAATSINGDFRMMHLTTIYALAVNDYVEVRVTQSSGGNLAISKSGSESPEFMMVRVA